VCVHGYNRRLDGTKGPAHQQLEDPHTADSLTEAGDLRLATVKRDCAMESAGLAEVPDSQVQQWKELHLDNVLTGEERKSDDDATTAAEAAVAFDVYEAVECGGPEECAISSAEAVRAMERMEFMRYAPHNLLPRSTTFSSSAKLKADADDSTLEHVEISGETACESVPPQAKPNAGGQEGSPVEAIECPDAVQINRARTIEVFADSDNPPSVLQSSAHDSGTIVRSSTLIGAAPLSVLLSAEFTSGIFTLVSAIIWACTVSYLGHTLGGEKAPYRSWAREGIGTPRLRI
jgi:hypothetical protein